MKKITSNLLLCIAFLTPKIMNPCDDTKKSVYCKELNCWQKTPCALHRPCLLKRLSSDILAKIIDLVGQPTRILHKLEPTPFRDTPVRFFPGHGTFERLADGSYRLTPFLRAYTKEPSNCLTFVASHDDLKAFLLSASNTRPCYFAYKLPECIGYLSSKPCPRDDELITKIMPANNGFNEWYKTMEAAGIPKKLIAEWAALKIARPEERSRRFKKDADTEKKE